MRYSQIQAIICELPLPVTSNKSIVRIEDTNAGILRLRELDVYSFRVFPESGF